MSEIYVGNLSFDTNEQGLQTLFSQYGQVDRVSLITDRDTGRSRGFAFVTMGDGGAAQSAIDALNGKEFEGRTLKVNEARGKQDRGGGGGGGGGGDRW